MLGVPMDLGAGRRGVDMGPSALRLAGLAPALGALGHRVVDHGNVVVPEPEATRNEDGPHFMGAIARACDETRTRLRTLPDDGFPLVLGGDHTVSLGAVAGVAGRGRTGLLWIDAHADLNTPTSSPSGNVHGMPVAALLGEGDERLTSLWGGGSLLRPEDVVFVGLRAVDDGERDRLRRYGMHAFTMTDVDRRGIAAVADEALAHLAHLPRLHVSFDADALDPDLAPGVGTPVKGGLTYREAHLLMELLSDAGATTSLDLVEVNPILDLRNRTSEIMVELAVSLLGKTIL